MFKSVLSISAIAFFAAIPAQSFAASTQDDVQSCRAAMTKSGILDMSETRLRFKSVRGYHKARTMHLEAINVHGKGSVKITCYLGTGKPVIAQRSNPNIKLAKK